MRKATRTAARRIGRHWRILRKGVVRIVYGAVTACGFAVALGEFAAVAFKGGYDAVWYFLLASATLVVAVGCVYDQGSRKK